MAQRVFVTGKVLKGMFPDERVLLVTDHAGRSYGFIVSVHELREEDGGEGAAEVILLDRRDDLAVIRFPGETLGDSNTISVRETALSPA